MCGILCICENIQQTPDVKEFDARKRLKKTLQRRGPDVHGEAETALSDAWKAIFTGYTLWLQGDAPACQPLRDTSGNILLWNGDAFRHKIDGDYFPNEKSDSQALLEKLQSTVSLEQLCAVLESIHGPWALIYYKKSLNKMIVGRDVYGRHSLLWNYQAGQELNSQLILSSTAEVEGFFEVHAQSLFEVDFSSNQLVIQPIYARKPYYVYKQPSSVDQLHEWSVLSKSSAEDAFQEYAAVWQDELEQLKQCLLDSVEVRTHCQPMLCKSCVSEKLRGTPDVSCRHSKIAIMFSGGLDSTVLAVLTDRVWPAEEAIDLLNVAFPSPAKTGKAPSVETFSVPDRLTGLQALEELKRISPSRKWNFVQVNVPLEELTRMRASRIASLIQPASTVLDDSIGCAQWFAARGEGHLLGESEETYVSPARVVLMGAGADEQMAGYARHRQRFTQGGWSSLAMEIEMEMNRISERNLGRDNRIIADHGRAPRLPYLDEKVVDYLAKLPVWAKADLRLPVGVGDKLILRALAHSLGLRRTSIEPKRAIQFGSRIAKAEARKEKGSHQCSRLLTKLSMDDKQLDL